MKRKLVSLMLVVIMLTTSVLPSFATPSPVYDPLALLDMLAEVSPRP